MKRFVIVLVWLLILAGGGFLLDRLLLGPRAESVILRETQLFYRDFRARLLALIRKPPLASAPAPAGLEPDTAGRPPAAETAPAKPAAENGGYVYVDQDGTIHLVNRLDEVPQRYRQEAKPLHK